MKIRNSQSIFKYYFEWVIKCRMSCKFVGGLLYPFFTWIQNQILVSRVFRETFTPLKSSESWIWELKLECNMFIFLYFFSTVSRNGIWIENKISVRMHYVCGTRLEWNWSEKFFTPLLFTSFLPHIIKMIIPFLSGALCTVFGSVLSILSNLTLLNLINIL